MTGGPITFRIFMNHITIFNSSTMEHVRTPKELFVTENRQWLETFVDCCYIDHVGNMAPGSDSETQINLD